MNRIIMLFGLTLTGCLGEDGLSPAITTQVDCAAGETCHFDFDLKDKEKQAISVRYFDETGQWVCLDIEATNDIEWSIDENGILSDVLYVDVQNSSSYEYEIFLHWVYEELPDCAVQI